MQNERKIQAEAIFLSSGMLFSDQTDESFITGEREKHMYSHKTFKNSGTKTGSNHSIR